MELILTPPIAFVIYVVLVAALYAIGRKMAPDARRSRAKSSIYAGGEVAETTKAAPGYRRFFIVALFFAVLHLGALVVATTGLAGGVALGAGLWVAIMIYLGGLAITLLILLLS